MANLPGLIEHLRVNQPATWSLVKLASIQGLVNLDMEGETLAIDSELGFRHPQLYQSLSLLLEEWSDPKPLVVHLDSQ